MWLRHGYYRTYGIYFCEKNWALRMFHSSILNKLSVFVQSSTPIQTESSFQLFCENSGLNLTNFTKLVICHVNSWKFCPRPKSFYTSATCATCATCDKFHVCQEGLVAWGTEAMIFKCCSQSSLSLPWPGNSSSSSLLNKNVSHPCNVIPWGNQPFKARAHLRVIEEEKYRWWWWSPHL